jgi:hypothetical protein
MNSKLEGKKTVEMIRPIMSLMLKDIHLGTPILEYPIF